MSTLTLTHPAPAHLAPSSFFEKPSTHFSAPRSPVLPLLSLLDLLRDPNFQLSPPPSPISNMSKVPEMTQVSASIFTTTPSTADAPPPYTPPTRLSKTQNPGFCPHAFDERHANTIPGGGRTGAQYFTPCACGYTISDEIPASYKEGWPAWIDPSVNYRWESHLPGGGGKKMDLEEGGGEKLGCWICFEYDGVWKGGMGVEEWYAHFRGHVRGEGYRVCRGKTGGMQRRRNCADAMGGGCSKVHS